MGSVSRSSHWRGGVTQLVPYNYHPILLCDMMTVSQAGLRVCHAKLLLLVVILSHERDADHFPLA